MTTSRERREKVAAAICDSFPDDPVATKYAQLKEIPQAAHLVQMYDTMADDALAAALPDRAAFDNAITELVACAMEWGVHEGEGRITADEQERLTNATADVVRSLVYGDDAQAGEVAG